MIIKTKNSCTPVRTEGRSKAISAIEKISPSGGIEGEMDD